MQNYLLVAADTNYGMKDIGYDRVRRNIKVNKKALC